MRTAIEARARALFYGMSNATIRKIRNATDRTPPVQVSSKAMRDLLEELER